MNARCSNCDLVEAAPVPARRARTKRRILCLRCSGARRRLVAASRGGAHGSVGAARPLKKAGMSIDDIDLFEVNEAFASVPVAWLRKTEADPSKLNVHGGAT